MASMRLFTRLLLAQLVTAAVVALLLFGLFYVDRSVTVSRLLAQRWAPAIHATLAEAGIPTDAAAAARSAARLQVDVLRRDALPAGAIPMAGIAPRYMALRNTLAASGLVVDRVAVSQEAGRPTVWLEMPRPAGQAPLWLGFTDPLVESFLPGRFVFSLLVCAGVMVGLSWLLARRIARPLDQLRQRLLGLQPGGITSPPGPPITGAGPEIAAIDSAWREMQQRLARHEHERALMLAGISHDLRSPLARIRLATELLPDEPALQPRRDSLMRNVQVADRLIESFLDHARALQLPLDQTVDLAAIAREALAAREAAGEPVQAELPAALPLPRSHPLLLERALANLLDNAFGHGRAPVSLRLQQRGGEVRLEVQDSGEGIPPAAREAALQAFSRGDASRGRPGTGLGLAVVQQTVQRLGGRIEFDGGPGRHIVRLVLPSERPPDAAI